MKQKQPQMAINSIYNNRKLENASSMNNNKIIKTSTATSTAFR